MDRREDHNEQNVYQKELEEQLSGSQVIYNDQVTIDGKQYRVPYGMVKEIEFSDVPKEGMMDMEHAARLQYRLMLQEPVLRAKVEFVKQKITIVYNPTEAKNNKPKISREELVSFLSKEGVRIDPTHFSEKDFDYLKEMYSYQFNPPSIRERPPYGYTISEWKRMRDKYNSDTEKGKEESQKKFKEWQDSYAAEHSEILSDKVSAKHRNPSIREKLFGKKKKGEKGFWFHGV